MHLHGRNKGDRKIPPCLLDFVIVVSCSSKCEPKYTLIYSCSHFELQKAQHVCPGYQLSLRVFQSANEAHDYGRTHLPIKKDFSSDDEFTED